MASRKILVGVVGGIILATAASFAADPLAYRSIRPADRAAKLTSLLASEDSTQRRQGAAKLADEIAMMASVLGENPDGVPFLATAGETMIPLLADERSTVKVRVERLLEQLIDGLIETAARGNPTAKDRAFTVLETLSPRMGTVEGSETVAAAAARADDALKSANRTPLLPEKPQMAAASPPLPAAPVKPAEPPVPPAPAPAPVAVVAAPQPKPVPPSAPTASVTAVTPRQTAASPVRPPARTAPPSGKPSAQDLIVLRMLDEKLRAAGERDRLAALELAEKVSETVRNGCLSPDAYMSRLSQNVTDGVRGFLTSPSASLRQMAARFGGAPAGRQGRRSAHRPPRRRGRRHTQGGGGGSARHHGQGLRPRRGAVEELVGGKRLTAKDGRHEAPGQKPGASGC